MFLRVQFFWEGTGSWGSKSEDFIFLSFVLSSVWQRPHVIHIQVNKLVGCTPLNLLTATKNLFAIYILTDHTQICDRHSVVNIAATTFHQHAARPQWTLKNTILKLKFYLTEVKQLHMSCTPMQVLLSKIWYSFGNFKHFKFEHVWNIFIYLPTGVSTACRCSDQACDAALI